MDGWRCAVAGAAPTRAIADDGRRKGLAADSSGEASGDAPTSIDVDMDGRRSSIPSAAAPTRAIADDGRRKSPATVGSGDASGDGNVDGGDGDDGRRTAAASRPTNDETDQRRGIAGSMRVFTSGAGAGAKSGSCRSGAGAGSVTTTTLLLLLLRLGCPETPETPAAVRAGLRDSTGGRRRCVGCCWGNRPSAIAACSPMPTMPGSGRPCMLASEKARIIASTSSAPAPAAAAARVTNGVPRISFAVMRRAGSICSIRCSSSRAGPSATSSVGGAFIKRGAEKYMY